MIPFQSNPRFATPGLKRFADPQARHCRELVADINQRYAVALPGRNALFLKELFQRVGVATRCGTAALAALAEAHANV